MTAKTRLPRASSLAILPLASALIAAPGIARAQLEGNYEIQISKKTDEKKSSRWTLADWLAYKQRAKVMDMWLAKNSHSSPFESFLELGSINADLGNGEPDASKSNSNSYGGALGFYAGVAGLRGTYAESPNDRAGSQYAWSGSFNLRLFGRAIQDTHLNLEYGLRGIGLTRPVAAGESLETFQNQFGGGSLVIYFTKHLGIEGTYHKVLPANSSLDRALEGELSQGSVFIDFGALRVFGAWKKEFRQLTGGGTLGNEFRKGFGGGLRLFF